MSAASSPHPVELLSALVDGELSTEERRLLDRHLGECAPCARLLREMQLVSRAAAAEEAPLLPANLEARVKARLAPVTARPAARSVKAGWGFRLPVAAAAAVAGGLALWVAARGFRGPSPPAGIVPPRTEVAAPRELRTDRDESGPAQAEESREGESAPGEGGRLRRQLVTNGEPGPGGDSEGVTPMPAPGALMEPPSAPGGENAPDAPPEDSYASTPPLGVSLEGEEKQTSGSAGDSRAKERQSVQSLEARPAAASKPDDEAVPRDSSAKDARTPAAPPSLLEMAPSEDDRRLTLRQVDGVTITLLESGHLRVEGPDYRCSVSLRTPSRPEERPEVISRLFMAADRALAGTPPTPPMKSKVAQPPPGGAAGAGGGQAVQGNVPDGASPVGESLSLTGSNGTTRLLAAPGMAAQGSEELTSILDALRQLALETYRMKIEDACGPLPGLLLP